MLSIEFISNYVPSSSPLQFNHLVDKVLVNFTRKIVYLLWLQNSVYIHSGIIIPVNVTEKYSKSSFKIRHWQRYCLHNLAPCRFSLYVEASAF